MARNEYLYGLIVNLIRRLEEVDVEASNVAWGEYMRIRVRLDIIKPLLRRKKFIIGELEPIWI